MELRELASLNPKTLYWEFGVHTRSTLQAYMCSLLCAVGLVAHGYNLMCLSDCSLRHLLRAKTCLLLKNLRDTLQNHTSGHEFKESYVTLGNGGIYQYLGSPLFGFLIAV